jgi:hypothetical protein
VAAYASLIEEALTEDEEERAQVLMEQMKRDGVKPGMYIYTMRLGTARKGEEWKVKEI